MCEGRKDFVLGLNYQRAGVFSALTQDGDGGHTLSPVIREAVRELKFINDPVAANLSIYMADFKRFELEVGQTMWETSVQVTDCSDSGLLGLLLPQMQQLTGVSNASSCSDMRHHCGKVGNQFLRSMCSVTCGCGDPYAGLFLNSYAEGCPREVCFRSKYYQDALKVPPCRDPSPQELQQHPGWKRYLQEYADYFLIRFPKYTSLVQSEVQSFKELGCDAVADIEIPIITRDNICETTLTHGSIRPFCPVACGCAEKMHLECPHSCGSSSANNTN